MTDSNPFLGAGDASSHENGINFAIASALSQVSVAIPVKIMSVSGGGVGPPGAVSVQPLIQMVDGIGQTPTPHGVINNIPFTRGQGSGNVIINDPVVGDVGLMVVAHRDISSLKSNNGAISSPGSRRTHDLADGIYIGSLVMQTTPTNYINMNGGNISIVSAGTVTVTAPNIKINGTVDINS